MDNDGDGVGDNEQKKAEEGKRHQMQLMIIIGVVVALAALGGVLYMRRNSSEEIQPKETNFQNRICSTRSTTVCYTNT